MTTVCPPSLDRDRIGYHKLTRWGFVVHGAIDGFSRFITMLQVNTNNRAETVLEDFLAACEINGIPSRVRTDKGGENVDLARAMILFRGTGRGSHLAGRSVNNQRIERLWGDLWNVELHPLYSHFSNMEVENVLQIDDDMHMFGLRYTYLSHVQFRLDSFTTMWNNHRVRTMRQTPSQVFHLTQHSGPLDDEYLFPHGHGPDWVITRVLNSSSANVDAGQFTISEEERCFLTIYAPVPPAHALPPVSTYTHVLNTLRLLVSLRPV